MKNLLAIVLLTFSLTACMTTHKNLKDVHWGNETKNILMPPPSVNIFYQNAAERVLPQQDLIKETKKLLIDTTLTSLKSPHYKFTHSTDEEVNQSILLRKLQLVHFSELFDHNSFSGYSLKESLNKKYPVDLSELKEKQSADYVLFVYVSRGYNTSSKKAKDFGISRLIGGVGTVHYHALIGLLVDTSTNEIIWLNSKFPSLSTVFSPDNSLEDVPGIFEGFPK